MENTNWRSFPFMMFGSSLPPVVCEWAQVLLLCVYVCV